MKAAVPAIPRLTGCHEKGGDTMSASRKTKPTYMIYYGAVDDRVVENAGQYDIAILHPRAGGLTRQQVERIQSAGTKVLAYLSVGEDLRTAGKTPEEMRRDPRFTGDGSGPRVDPRSEGETALGAMASGAMAPGGHESPGGCGYASYYLDDNDHDGKPDFNPNFGCAYTNIGDPNWYEVLHHMTLDGEDGVPGIREILTRDYGRGLGCDGLFLDTIDTCAPNAYTSDDDPSRTRFEWTAAGVRSLFSRIKSDYPGTLICQNRGLFFYHHLLEHYRYTPRTFVDYLLFESYRLNSDRGELFHEGFFADNKFSLVPKLAVESRRPDGFVVLSLGYAEGPEAYDLADSLTGKSEIGREILLQDIEEAEKYAGFSHYLTNAGLTLLNDFVKEQGTGEDVQSPVWSSVYNPSDVWPPREPEPRVGLGEITSEKPGCVTVRWDVALDESGVAYLLYFGEGIWDPADDLPPGQASRVVLTPTVSDAYEAGVPDAYPYFAEVEGLESGKTYSFLLRATDTSPARNEEKNTVIKTVTIISS